MWRKCFLLGLLVITASICSQARAQTDDQLSAAIRKAGHAKVAATSYPPYTLISPSGEATGAWIEQESLALKALGLPGITPVVSGWDGMLPALQSHQVDF